MAVPDDWKIGGSHNAAMVDCGPVWTSVTMKCSVPAPRVPGLRGIVQRWLFR